MNTSRNLLIGLLVGAAACGGKRANDADYAPRVDRSVIVVRGSDMSGNLLDGLRMRVPTMMVGNRQAGACPQIMFRGPRSIRNQGNPSLYVDGALMVDTCILTQITAADVERVEIYTNSNAGSQRNPFGTIMVYRLRE